MKPAKSRVLIYPALQVQPASMALARAELENMPVSSARGGKAWGRILGIIGACVGALIVPGYIVLISLGYQPLEIFHNAPVMTEIIPAEPAAQVVPVKP